MIARKVVLAAGVDLDAIDDLALDQGWQLTNVLPGGPRRPAQRLFTTRDGATVVYFVEDARLGIVYVAAQGEGAAWVLAAVRERLATVAPLTKADLAADEAPAAMDLAPRLAALALEGVEAPGGAEILSTLLQDADAARRSVALTALTYCPWPSPKPLLGRMAADDEDPALRQAAGQVLQALYP